MRVPTGEPPDASPSGGRRSVLWWIALFRAAALAATLAACGSEASGPTPTGSTCSDQSLTYEDFGAPFMEAYCTRCHDSELHGSDRQGAPLYHDFETFDGVIVVADHIDEWAAAGPDAVNRLMPPDGAAPSDDERRDLGIWLACELDNL